MTRIRPKNCRFPIFFLDCKIDSLIDCGAERSLISGGIASEMLLYPCHLTETGEKGEKIPSYGQISGKVEANTLSIVGAFFH